VTDRQNYYFNYVIRKTIKIYTLITQFYRGILSNKKIFVFIFRKFLFIDKRPEDDEQWPRIVRDVLKCSKHTICRMCTNSGELKEEIFTKYKHGKYVSIIELYL